MYVAELGFLQYWVGMWDVSIWLLWGGRDIPELGLVCCLPLGVLCALSSHGYIV